MHSNRTNLGFAVLATAALLLPSYAAAQPQSSAQQKCINALNKDAAKIARAQSKGSATCIKNAGKGVLGGQTAQECVESDNKGKVGSAKAKLLGDEAKRCGSTPDFGSSGGQATNQAAETEDLSLLADIFGAPLEDAILTAAGANCQAKVLKSAAKIQQTKLKEFIRCKKAGLRDLSIDSDVTLDGCFGAITLDGKGKIAKTQAKLLKVLQSSKCFGASDPLFFPGLFAGACIGETATAPDLAVCVDRTVECRVCRHLNIVDNLTHDCDLFDDTLANGSCDNSLPNCADGIKNQNETDVDCGGVCLGCSSGEQCIVDVDCESLVCLAAVCQVATCSDLVQNQDESDTDCGGGSCPACTTGQGCNGPTDCDSLVCTASQCVAATCSDGISNGDETGVDCGGGTCGACGTGEGCDGPSDCLSLVCIANVCQPAGCSDLIQNGDETDVDCGGSCPGCADGLMCLIGPDCQSGVCTGNICIGATCSDSVQNQDETDVDCGGSCSGCPVGDNCLVSGDCLSGNCAGGVCGPADCQEKGSCFMFVTANSSGGNLGGLAGADATCNSEASSAGICGGTGQVPCSYQAWLCDGITSPNDRSTKATVPYIRTDSATIAANWAGLTDGGIDNGINHTAAGLNVSGQAPFLPWTHVKTDGTCDDETYLSPGSGPCPAFSNCPLNCDNNGGSPGWDSSSGLVQGSKGDINNTGGNWTDGVTGLCSTPAERVYCIEQ